MSDPGDGRGVSGAGRPGAANGARVIRLAWTPVKGTRLATFDAVSIEAGGVPGDRRFFIVDERGRMINGKTAGELSQVLSSLAGDRLRLEFPDGRVVEDEVAAGERFTARFYSRQRQVAAVPGPFSEALSAYMNRPLQLVEAESGIDRGQIGAVSLISSASVTRLAQEGGEPSVDSRRFRMLVEVEGLSAHEEDEWVGRSVHIGTAVVRFRGHVGRCLITSRDPQTGEIDLPTLDLIGRYRGQVESTEPLPFGIYGEVVEPGEVRLGDPVAVGDAVTH